MNYLYLLVSLFHLCDSVHFVLFRGHNKQKSGTTLDIINFASTWLSLYLKVSHNLVLLI